jgi:hypothetical protein
MKIDFEETLTGAMGPIQRKVIKIHFKFDLSFTYLVFMKLACASQSGLLVNDMDKWYLSFIPLVVFICGQTLVT